MVTNTAIITSDGTCMHTFRVYIITILNETFRIRVVNRNRLAQTAAAAGYLPDSAWVVRMIIL